MATAISEKSTVRTVSVKTPLKTKIEPVKEKKFGREEEAGALWVKESKSDGKEYMTGDIVINGQKTSVIVFRNNYKEQANHPDWRIYRRPDIEGESE